MAGNEEREIFAAQPARPDVVQRRSARRLGASGPKESRAATNVKRIEGGENCLEQGAQVGPDGGGQDFVAGDVGVNGVGLVEVGSTAHAFE